MKIVFFGTPEFAVPSLEALHASGHEIALVVAQPDRPAGRGMRMQSPAVAVRARSLGLELIQPEKIRTEPLLEHVRKVAPEVGVVIAYGRILPQHLLEIPPRGFINVHGSVLPRYRGAAPIQRAIEQGERETGVSIMQLDAQMDHGPVFTIARTPIGPDERTPELARRLSEVGAGALIGVLQQLEAGTAEAREQDHAAATLAPRIEKGEGLIDWTISARRIYDRFRAFWPWPGIHIRFRNESVKLTSIEVDSRSGPAGMLLDDSGVVVGAGHESIRILEMQRPGKRPVAASEFIRAAGLGPGEPLS